MACALPVSEMPWEEVHEAILHHHTAKVYGEEGSWNALEEILTLNEVLLSVY